MRVRIFVEPQQGASDDELLRVAVRADELGFDGFFRSDHFLTMGGDGLPGPTDAWVTLGAIAGKTSRIRLGTLVSSATFRHPGILAVTVAQVDALSAGRVELGLGAGWFEEEHRAYGIPFPTVAERFDRLEEQLEIVTGLWSTPLGETFTHRGSHYVLEESPALPKPVQSPRPPVIVGGGGPVRTPALAARFADELNVAFRPLDATARQFERGAAACEAIGRDPGSLCLSAAAVVCCGENQEEVLRRAKAIGRDPGELREHGVAGTPDEVLVSLGRYEAIGVATIYLQVLDLTDLDHLSLLAAAVLPELG